MVLNTLTVGASVTPTVARTYASHYIHRRPRKQKPTAHIRYDEGLNLIRQFLRHASEHTVEEVQAFTAQWVPTPRWVRCEGIAIPEQFVKEAAQLLIEELGEKGINQIGGKEWWQWRRDGLPLRADWVEMRSHYNERNKTKQPCTRVMLYVHGGAYFFGSPQEHRYQMQRHARKLKARLIAPYYRLAPQFPFPCGLQDCLAVYLYLLTIQDPSTIVLAGDSAGAGMVLSLLVTLRDQNKPLPSGAILISPWVDLTHSFPSVSGKGELDYIPSHGFMQRPSIAWPPPNADDMEAINLGAIRQMAMAEMPRKTKLTDRDAAADEAVQGFTAKKISDRPDSPQKSTAKRLEHRFPQEGHNLSIILDDHFVEIKDQIQMYAQNALLAHPLVSPVMQPSLGGLPPLLILTGGGELLRDEQIYIAHKAANPAGFPPPAALLEGHPAWRETVHQYKPTSVQLQVWDDLCHVAPTLSFTRPAKYMFRSIAQFGAWALARAQRTTIDILDDDEISIISTESDKDAAEEDEDTTESTINTDAKPMRAEADRIGTAGDALPPFRNHMIRQRVTRHGAIYPLPPVEELPALQMPPDEIGSIKPGPVSKWLKAKSHWDTRFAREKRRVQKQRIKEITRGYQTFADDEVPPPSALAGRRGAYLPPDRAPRRSMGLSLWSLWGSKHDEKTIELEAKADAEPESAAVQDESQERRDPQAHSKHQDNRSRSRSHVRQVADLGQDQDTALADDNEHIVPGTEVTGGLLSPDFVPRAEAGNKGRIDGSHESELVLRGTNVTLDSAIATRPKADGVAFPFKLAASDGARAANASTVTLQSEDLPTPKEETGIEKSRSKVDGDSKSASIEPGAQGEGRRPGTTRFVTAQEDLA